MTMMVVCARREHVVVFVVIGNVDGSSTHVSFMFKIYGKKFMSET